MSFKKSLLNVKSLEWRHWFKNVLLSLWLYCIIISVQNLCTIQGLFSFQLKNSLYRLHIGDCTPSHQSDTTVNIFTGDWVGHKLCIFLLNRSVKYQPDTGYWYLRLLVGVWSRWFTPVQCQDFLHREAILKSKIGQRLVISKSEKNTS